MKARRYVKPDRDTTDLPTHTTTTEQPMTDDQFIPPEVSDNTDTEMPQAIEVDVGKSMPNLQASQVPTLGESSAPAVPAFDATEAQNSRSMLAEGMQFVGNAVLRGPFSVAGHIEGNLTQAQDTHVSVIVTETGQVKGDITAFKISVMGRTEGVLDSGPGEVALHDSASVHGLVRYGRIQVNGADLNATLERFGVAKKSS